MASVGISFRVADVSTVAYRAVHGRMRGVTGRQTRAIAGVAALVIGVALIGSAVLDLGEDSRSSTRPWRPRHASPAKRQPRRPSRRRPVRSRRRPRARPPAAIAPGPASTPDSVTRVAAFTTVLIPAMREADAVTLVAILHPATIERYGLDACLEELGRLTDPTSTSSSMASVRRHRGTTRPTASHHDPRRPRRRRVDDGQGRDGGDRAPSRDRRWRGPLVHGLRDAPALVGRRGVGGAGGWPAAGCPAADVSRTVGRGGPGRRARGSGPAGPRTQGRPRGRRSPRSARRRGLDGCGTDGPARTLSGDGATEGGAEGGAEGGPSATVEADGARRTRGEASAEATAAANVTSGNGPVRASSGDPSRPRNVSRPVVEPSPDDAKTSHRPAASGAPRRAGSASTGRRPPTSTGRRCGTWVNSPSTNAKASSCRRRHRCA